MSDALRLDVFDSHDLLDLVGDMDLYIHLCCTDLSARDKLESTLQQIIHIFSRYIPNTNKLVKYIGEFSDFIYSNNSRNNINEILYLYDCFSHDLMNFIEYASTVGMSKENEHIIYKPTYIGIQQLLASLRNEDNNTEYEIEFF